MINTIEYKGYKIERWVVAVVYDPDIHVLGEYTSMSEAKDKLGGVPGVYFKFAAAEWINKDGDLNPAVYGDSLSEVTKKIKKILFD